MFRFTKTIAAALVALAFLAVVAPASANTVQYYVTGSFGLGTFNTGTGTALFSNSATPGGSSSVTVNSPSAANALTSTLTFSFGGPHDINYGPAQFGTFSVSSNDNSGAGDSFSGLTFSLNIFQSAPAGGNGTLIGTVDGTLRKGSGPTVPSSVSLMFEPNRIIIPNSGPNQVVYTVAPAMPGAPPVGNFDTEGLVLINTGPATTPLTGTVAAPLPSTAKAGFLFLGGFGCLGLVGHLRRNRTAVA